MSEPKEAKPCRFDSLEIGPKAYFSIDSPTSAIAILTALGLLILYMISSEIGPVDARVTNNEKVLNEVKVSIDKGFDKTDKAIEGLRQIIISEKK